MDKPLFRASDTVLINPHLIRFAELKLGKLYIAYGDGEAHGVIMSGETAAKTWSYLVGRMAERAVEHGE